MRRVQNALILGAVLVGIGVVAFVAALLLSAKKKKEEKMQAAAKEGAGPPS
ncbi:MAG: hypothetical protein HYV07_06125 [Deltaproteobacteria bacterium]|nr:hypothetical protein [Deltaproteobacteria bacterium]